VANAIKVRESCEGYTLAIEEKKPDVIDIGRCRIVHSLRDGFLSLPRMGHIAQRKKCC
jgi:hypothetical protein